MISLAAYVLIHISAVNVSGHSGPTNFRAAKDTLNGSSSCAYMSESQTFGPGRTKSIEQPYHLQCLFVPYLRLVISRFDPDGCPSALSKTQVDFAPHGSRERANAARYMPKQHIAVKGTYVGSGVRYFVYARRSWRISARLRERCKLPRTHLYSQASRCTVCEII